MSYQTLFDHMHDEHGLILLQTEMQEIIHIVQNMEAGKIEPNSPEMWQFLLVNALRLLTEEQRAELCFDLYCRSTEQEAIDKKIHEFKTASK